MGKDLNRFRGCLLGGAAGDALGYAVEFMTTEDIFVRYGENGITEYELQDGKALFSDDTQMTLFTANGLLTGTTMNMTGGHFISYPSTISLAYHDWLLTQNPGKSFASISWLNNIPQLNKRRAPGNTCLDALSSGILGTVASPVNDSKGCGGVTRVAPVGLYLSSIGFSLYDADMIAAEAAAITHGHPLGYIPAAALAQIIGYAVNMPSSPLLHSVMSAKHAINRLFPDEPDTAVVAELIDKAIELSMMDLDDLDAIRQLGEGRVAEECLAIAIYCALKHSDDFEAALIAAVNHDGDSDSTGAVTGNILGAFLGLSAIPEKFLRDLEMKDVILEIADDLYNDCPISYDDVMEDKIWVSKYIKHDFIPGKDAEEEPAPAPVFKAAVHQPIHDKCDEILENQISLDEIIDEQEIKAEKERKRREEEEAEAKRLEELRRAAEEKKAEEQRKAKEAEKAEERRKAKEAEKAEEQRRAKEKKKAEEQRKAEEAPKPKGKPAPSGQITLAEAAANAGVMKFYEWTDASFGGYDVVLSCDNAAYARLCSAFQGCPMDAVADGGKRWFLVDSQWEEITPLRKAEYLHPEGAESPRGKELKKFRFNAAAYSYRVYTDKEV